MQISSAIDGLALPTEANFFYATNSGSVFAKYQSADGEWVFVEVPSDQFVADLVSANIDANRVVTNTDISHIVADVHNQALAKAGNVRITPPRYKTKKEKQAS